jgi:hypothetical protein
MRKRRRKSAEPSRPAPEELGGESEYSVLEAHLDEIPSTRRRKGARDREINVSVSDLGRHYVESVKQEAAEFDEVPEPLRGPVD